MTVSDLSENALVEQSVIALFRELGYNCFYEKVGDSGSKLGSQSTADVILWPRLSGAFKSLNPQAGPDAIEAIGKDRSAMIRRHLPETLVKDVPCLVYEVFWPVNEPGPPAKPVTKATHRDGSPKTRNGCTLPTRHTPFATSGASQPWRTANA